MIGFLLIATSALACQVPVFRYALERWPADRYEIVILHDGPLGKSDMARIDVLRESDHTSVVAGNYDVRTIEIEEIQDELLTNLWKQHRRGGKPVMVVLYPRNAQDIPNRVAHVSPFVDEAVRNLSSSPVRQKIAKEMLDGQSAVWIFVPSGDAEQDAVALKTLTEQVKRNEQELELPPQEEIEADEFFQEETDIELRIGFSIVTLRRDDPEERLLLKLLMRSEPDLETLAQRPMAFPVLGRGRVLYALVGKGISQETIGIASRFIVGPCSCQVKNQNPGFDLLLAVNWDEKISGSTLTEPLPETTAEPIKLKIPPGRSAR